MTTTDDLLARADNWVACGPYDWPVLGTLVADLAAALRAAETDLATTQTALRNVAENLHKAGLISAKVRNDILRAASVAPTPTIIEGYPPGEGPKWADSSHPAVASTPTTTITGP